MRAKKATLISFLAPSAAALSFCLPHRNAQQQQRCSRSSIFSGRPTQGCPCSSAFNPKRGGRGRARLSDSRPSCSQHVVVMAAGKPDTAAAAATAGDAATAAAAGSSNRRNPRQRVSRALNRALGTVLATGDMFGSVSQGVSEDNSFGGHFTSAVGQEDRDDGSSDAEEEESIEDEGGQADVEDLLAGRNRLSVRNFQQEERSSSSSSANRLLRANTGASAAVVVDGPFSALQAYMTLPVSEYSLLDSSIIRRVSETSFRFQIPLKDFVGLDFTPTMEVEVELDRPAGAVVFRSTRSTLYGNVGKPGEEASTNPWPEAGSSQVEYFRVGFDARLRWVDGDASLTPRRQRGRGGFAGTFARRPRPEAEPAPPPTAAAGPVGDADGGGETTGDVGGVRSGGDGGVVGPPAVAAGEAAASAVEPPTDGELAADVEPATVFCDTEVKVQVLLPPPYNTLLPWRLVRVLLGKLLSTIVAYILPRFLELLADDFYGWQSGTRRAAATADETGRTLLGGTGGGGVGGGNGAGTSFPAVGQQAGTQGSADAPGQQQANEGARWRGGGGGSSVTENSNSINIRNPVVGGLQRLRNVRGPRGDRGRRRRQKTAGAAAAAAAVAGEDATTAAPVSSTATMRPPTATASADGAAPPEEGFQEWTEASAVSSTSGLSGEAFNFEVSVQEEAGVGEEERGNELQGRRRRWRGGRDRGVGGGGGGGGSINWWG